MFISKRPRVINLADIIKITIMLIQATYEEPIKVERTTKNV